MERRRDADIFSRPGRLKLEFSRAADYARIDALFDPETKEKLDPQDFVARRVEEFFRKAVDEGAACMLSDEDDNVRGLTIAYRVHECHPPTGSEPHDFTEFGTSITSIPGYNSTRLIIAALAIREFLWHPPKSAIVADIKNANGASLKTYRDALGWIPMDDPAMRAHTSAVTDKTVASEQHKSKGPASEYGVADEWHVCDETAIAVQASILLQYMNAGGITDKKTGDFIPVDFSTLPLHGINHPALEFLAGGGFSGEFPPAPKI